MTSPSTSHTRIFINGTWTEATGTIDLAVIDSFTEAKFATYRSATSTDVDAAVKAAHHAFASWSACQPEQRIAAVRRVAVALRERADVLASVISREVGMPRKLSARIQVGAPITAWDMNADLAATIDWEKRVGHSLVTELPVGVVACITPWNYPLHQITCKVVPALLAGCTVVLKPSELAPSSAFLLAEAIEEAGLPPGVFNLVHGTGPDIGESLVRHPLVDMVSFTGSTRAGRRIAALAGEDIKRVALELGGKSAALVLSGADVPAAVKGTLGSCMLNSGQTCSATTRMLIPRESYEIAVSCAQELVAGYKMGDPADSTTRLGPLISSSQQEKVNDLISRAIAAGAVAVAGPNTVIPTSGFFVAPTVLRDVTPDMEIAREEVFGPVLVLMAYDTEEEGVAMANSTDYGLAGAVWGPTVDKALSVARRLRIGQVDVNGAPFNLAAPFGGFKKSGLGRENGLHGLMEYLEPMAIQLPASHFDTETT